MRATWDIFCNVVDNYGDIGIAWRLARGLAREHGAAVRLWIDDLHVFHQIWPAISPDAERQVCEDVAICAWHTPFPAAAPAQVVIEAFGCELPEAYLAAMSRQSTPPVWINLEYLSAEAWVDDHHALPSPHPRLPLTKYFFFPGYTPQTGGLLVEAGLEAARHAFLDAGTMAFWQRFGLDVPKDDELRVSLFAYETAALGALLDAWAGDTSQVTCLVPEGRVIPQLAAWLDVEKVRAGDAHRRGTLQLHILPFVDQDTYDRLLWACHLNFVRGEDSCVRAQWAARPMVWQAYPQMANAHWSKLVALLDRYTASLDSTTADAIRGMWRSWNGMPGWDVATSWAGWRSSEAAIAQHAKAWCEQLGRVDGLTAKLVDFVQNKLK